MKIKIWDSKASYYAERGGERSGEKDFGVHNRDDILGWSDFAWGGISVSVIDQTGDIIAWQERPERVALLGNLGIRNEAYNIPDGRTSEVYELADQVFSGFAETAYLGRPLSWYMARLTERNRNDRYSQDIRVRRNHQGV